jgi:uncharacterized protein
MTQVIFTYSKDHIQSFEINGHANYAKYGKDIVCAGISTAVIMTINLIDKITQNYHFTKDEDKGIITFEWTNFNKETIVNQKYLQIGLDNLYETLKQIANEYPNNISITIEK